MMTKPEQTGYSSDIVDKLIDAAQVLRRPLKWSSSDGFKSYAAIPIGMTIDVDVTGMSAADLQKPMDAWMVKRHAALQERRTAVVSEFGVWRQVVMAAHVETELAVLLDPNRRLPDHVQSQLDSQRKQHVVGDEHDYAMLYDALHELQPIIDLEKHFTL